MRRVRPPSEQTLAVLEALATDPTVWRYGYDLSQQTGLKAGSMYPILIRLADRALLETAWETVIPRGRPPRHLYRVTASGLRVVAESRKSRAEAARGSRRRLRPRLAGAE